MLAFHKSQLLFLSTLAVGQLFLDHVALAKNMNAGGPYKIANSDAFDSEFSDDREYFDVYSKPIKTLYSQVHWTEHRDIPLPQDIIDRFEGGKLMAITGYEVDQIRRLDSGEEIPVPITWAYNHHYCAYLMNNRKFRAVMKQTTAGVFGEAHGASHHLVGEFRDGMEPDDDEEEIPQMHFFSEGNGGEMRMSYHGYPKGYAQIIESPNEFIITPMQIDTWNRNMQNHTYLPGPLPSKSVVPQDAGYSGLLECPCSDRLPFEWGMTYTFDENTNKCKGSVQNATECFKAAESVIKGVQYSTQIVDDESLPSGCSGSLDEEGKAQGVWNNAESTLTRRHGAMEAKDSRLVGVSLGLVNMTVLMDTNYKPTIPIQLTLTGPSDKWFAVGFGANKMCVHMEGDECLEGGPYAIIVAGEEVVERKLDFHGPGTVLSNSITLHSNQVKNGIRTVRLSRPMEGPTDKHFAFDVSLSSIPLIMAKGCSLKFAQHCGHGPSSLNLLPVNIPKKLCQSGIEGTIDGNQFSDLKCAPFPDSDLLNQKNPTCHIQTYNGGLYCCRHGKSLLDTAQEIPWQDQPLEYYLKFRFYFEEYTKLSEEASPSHQQLVRMAMQTAPHGGEYDIPQCREGTPPSKCVHTITSRKQVRRMTRDCSIHDASHCTGKGSTNSSLTAGVKLIYAGPHCHAPTCLSMDLYNADTGQLLCHVETIHGSGKDIYDEEGFLAIPPCLWGDASEGLAEPPLLSLDTTLLSIKRCNSTLAHTGEMGIWQMRGIVVKAERKEVVTEKNETMMSPARGRRTRPLDHVVEDEILH